MWKKAAGLLLLTLLVIPATAQDDYAFYMSEAGSSSLLYRGRRAFEYPILFNGTYWWSGPAFRNGEVSYNGKHYRDVQLNIDAARQELIVQDPVGLTGKLLAGDLVESFVIDGTRYLNLRSIYGPEAPGGYWQVLYDGDKKFVRQVTKQLVQDLDGSKRSQIGEVFSEYKRNVFNVFIQNVAYGCVLETGEFVPVRRRSHILNIDRERRRDVRHHIGVLEARSSMMPIESLGVEVLKFLENR